ncbi:MAG: hypothetical protein DRG25_03260, partial [Deltaproteobacteria bacterium]
IKYSYEILLNAAEWLIQKGRLKKEDYPIRTTERARTRYVINNEPKHSDGKDFKRPKRLSNDLYIETKFKTNRCKKLARELLEKYGYPGDMLVVE